MTFCLLMAWHKHDALMGGVGDNGVASTVQAQGVLSHLKPTAGSGCVAPLDFDLLFKCRLQTSRKRPADDGEQKGDPRYPAKKRLDAKVRVFLVLLIAHSNA